MVLIKSVLTNLVVYWFATARCPRSILNILRKSIFTFLWGILMAILISTWLVGNLYRSLMSMVAGILKIWNGSVFLSG